MKPKRTQKHAPNSPLIRKQAQPNPLSGSTRRGIKLGKKRSHLIRFIQFGLVGFSGLIVDIVVFYLLREIMRFPWYISTVFSIEVAIINNFLWNDAWTFADLAHQAKGWPARLKRFCTFNAVCIFGAGLQIGIMALLLLIPTIHRLPNILSQVISAPWTSNAHEYVTKVIAIVLVTLWNYSLNLTISWRSRK
ncbi:MAG: GtrA family protein [Cyanobacteria bacterium P01_A01_bin.116]